MFTTIKIKNTNININSPDECPNCHKSIESIYRGNIFVEDESMFYVCFICSSCRKTFLARYYYSDNSYLTYPNKVLGGTKKHKEHSAEIIELSSEFVSIYDEALTAEHEGLETLSAMGYRLALEHLIKAYCIRLHPNEKQAINENSLSTCIKKHLPDDIKELLEKTSWLGNDYAHVVNKHENITFKEYKELVDICILEIEKEIKKAILLEKIDKK